MKEKLEAQKAKREKAEDAKRLAELRAQIAAEKAARFGTKTEEPEKVVEKTPEVKQEAPKTTEKKVFTTCDVQIRLSNGQAIKNTFTPNDTIGFVTEWVAANRTDGKGAFYLMTNFPKVIFTEELYDTTLQDAGLCLTC